MEEEVILVDINDNQIGTAEKLEAHKKGFLHRAFSICIFNDQNQLLLQKRAAGKYHCPNLWSNSCCSHPRPNETLEKATCRRLQEEMGFDTSLHKKGHILYKAKLDNALIEHEFDHIFIGRFNKKICYNQEEVQRIQWVSLEDLQKDMQVHPDIYTPWLDLILLELLTKT